MEKGFWVILDQTHVVLETWFSLFLILFSAGRIIGLLETWTNSLVLIVKKLKLTSKCVCAQGVNKIIAVRNLNNTRIFVNDV